MISTFVKICSSYPVDYEKLTEMLNNGFDINSEVEDPFEGISILSNITMGWGSSESITEDERGRAFYELVKFFIDNDFDVKKYGGGCLHALCWSNAGQYILNIAEMLLENGADTTEKYDEDDEKGVLDTIDWQLGDWVIGDGREANLMTPFYEMVNAYEEGREYHGFRAFESCIGNVVTRIEKVAFTEEECTFNKERKNAFAGGIILWCNDVPLLLNHYGELYVDPKIEDKSMSKLDVSEPYRDILGLKIKDLKYIDGNQGIGLVSFENSDKELFFNGVLRSEGKLRYALLNIIDFNNRSNIEFSNIQELYFASGRSYAPYVKDYREKFIVVKCKHTSYLIYSEGEYHEEHKLRVANVKNWVNHGKLRSIKLKGPSFKGYVLNEDKTIKAIVIDTFDRRIIFRTDCFDEMKVVFIDKNEELLLDDKYFNGQYSLCFDEIEKE